MRCLLLLTLLGTTLGWKAIDIDRSIDVSTQIIKISSLYTFENSGSAEKTVKIPISQEEDDHLAFISANIEGSKGKLKISKDTVKTPGFQVYNVDLPSPTPSGQKLKIRLNAKVTHSLVPLPEKIAQSDSQFVVYHGSAYAPSAYPIANQQTVIKTTSGGKTLSSTTVEPTKQESQRVVYGPYQNIGAFENKPVKVHYENNSPFVIATYVERVIEVSHWGNIAVEEYIELVHKGAKLEGSFSRLHHQSDRRGRRMPALQYFTTVLPATARDIYYRDEIGNISTSAVRIRADSVDVDIRPRFPLFGGWKTSYVIGYNVPSEEYLYNKGNQYALKMRLFDHIFDNIVVEKLVTKVILPEKIRKVKVKTPYQVDRRPDEIKPTYLDTTGRLVIVLEKENVVADHIQQFTISYEFDFKDMLREPILASAFFLTLFAVIIIYSRFDFTISTSATRDAEERTQRLTEQLSKLVDAKQAAYEQLINASSEYKSTRDQNILIEAKKNLVNVRNSQNSKLENKQDGNKDNGKIAELIKYDKVLFDLVDSYLKAVEKSTTKSASADEQQFIKKVQEVRDRADNLLASF